MLKSSFQLLCASNIKAAVADRNSTLMLILPGFMDVCVKRHTHVSVQSQKWSWVFFNLATELIVVCAIGRLIGDKIVFISHLEMGQERIIGANQEDFCTGLVVRVTTGEGGAFTAQWERLLQDPCGAPSPANYIRFDRAACFLLMFVSPSMFKHGGSRNYTSSKHKKC